MDKIEGYIEQIIYKNTDNGYTVLSVINNGTEITLVGYLGHLHEGEYIEADTEESHHPTYGTQYQVKYYQVTMPENVIAMERYLGSGLIKGIGPALAKKIVNRFKKDTFTIIEQEPERLVQIKGISEKKAQTIAQLFEEKKEMRQAMMFLQNYGISTTYAAKIYKQYKGKTYDIIKTNPYQLAEDISGIGFQMADSIASSLGIETTSHYRIKSGIDFLLIQASIDGHTYLPKSLLLKKAEELLSISQNIIEHVLLDLQINKHIMQKTIVDEVVVYNTIYYYMELSVARNLHDLNMVYSIEENEFQKKIDMIQKDTNIILDEIQIEAVKQAVKNGVFIITGGPGTGKTTTINAIIKYFESEDLDILLAAPTGRAAKRITETTGYEAKTIHRLLEMNYKNEDKDELSRIKFEKKEDNPLEADVIIVDETSMIDIVIMHHLLKAIVQGTRLILVGDMDQLPSVGAGNVLRDIICSNTLEKVKLTRIFRQANQSDIIVNAHKINTGQILDLKKKSNDFFYINRLKVDTLIEELKTLIKTRLPRFTGCSVFNGIQILTPMRKGLLGTENLNIIIQSVINPSHKSKQEKEYRQKVFREGDKVMQIKNNYQIVWQIKNEYNYVIDEGTGVFNGDVGIIKSINNYTEKIEVVFDDEKSVEYEFNQLDEIELAYAVTIHKSQGSEYPVIILPLLGGPQILLNRNILYTAITRAKKYVVIVGSNKTVDTMIKNERELKRFTSLQIRLNEMFDL